MEDVNNKENEEIKVIEANAGEMEGAYFTRLKLLKDQGGMAYGKWQGITFSINTEIGPEKEILTLFSKLVKYAIKNGMTQLSMESVDSANTEMIEAKTILNGLEKGLENENSKDD